MLVWPLYLNERSTIFHTDILFKSLPFETFYSCYFLLINCSSFYWILSKITWYLFISKILKFLAFPFPLRAALFESLSLYIFISIFISLMRKSLKILGHFIQSFSLNKLGKHYSSHNYSADFLSCFQAFVHLIFDFSIFPIFPIFFL